MNKKLIWALLASLTANVFFGVVIGIHLSQGPKPPPHRPGQMLEDMVEILPPADAALLRTAMDAHRAELSEPREHPREHLERMRQALLAEPFDIQVFRQVDAEFRASRERTGAAIGEVLAEALPQMSPEGRKRLADFRPPRK
ncbi:MAG TPA: periplasmic heavy metal sensor [Magnetospirillum sp.]|jgi:hypothetical protein|nr:periplasmic heavy metal sensor [Magnetospirillum sp.]